MSNYNSARRYYIIHDGLIQLVYASIVFRRLFEEVVRQCVEAGLVSAHRWHGLDTCESLRFRGVGVSGRD